MMPPAIIYQDTKAGLLDDIANNYFAARIETFFFQFKQSLGAGGFRVFGSWRTMDRLLAVAHMAMLALQLLYLSARKHHRKFWESAINVLARWSIRPSEMILTQLLEAIALDDPKVQDFFSVADDPSPRQMAAVGIKMEAVRNLLDHYLPDAQKQSVKNASQDLWINFNPAERKQLLKNMRAMAEALGGGWGEPLEFTGGPTVDATSAKRLKRKNSWVSLSPALRPYRDNPLSLNANVNGPLPLLAPSAISPAAKPEAP